MITPQVHRVLDAAQQLVDAVALVRGPGWARVVVRTAPVAGFAMPVEWHVTPRPPERPSAEEPLWLGSDDLVQNRHISDLVAELRAALAADGVAWTGEQFAVDSPVGGPLVLRLSDTEERATIPVRSAIVDDAAIAALAAAWDAHGPPVAAEGHFDPAGSLWVDPAGSVPAQFAGSYAPNERTWLWGWGNPDPRGTAAVEALCRASGLQILMRRGFRADPMLAAHLGVFVASRLGGRCVFRQRGPVAFYVR